MAEEITHFSEQETLLEQALRYWIADLEGVSVLQVKEATLEYDPGWSGTDVTPGDPPEFVISYTIVVEPRHEVKRIENTTRAVGAFIGEIAETSRRVNR